MSGGGGLDQPKSNHAILWHWPPNTESLGASELLPSIFFSSSIFTFVDEFEYDWVTDCSGHCEDI